MSEAIVVDNMCCANRNAMFDHDGKGTAGPSAKAMKEPALIPQSDHQTGYFHSVWQPCGAETHPFHYDPLKNCEPETGSRVPYAHWRRMWRRAGMPMRTQGCVGVRWKIDTLRALRRRGFVFPPKPALRMQNRAASTAGCEE